jgi:hypothetical protein
MGLDVGASPLCAFSSKDATSLRRLSVAWVEIGQAHGEGLIENGGTVGRPC